MKKTLPISIVIPAKNEEKNLRNLFSDIKNQTHQPKEVILADANSQDKTKEVCKEFGVKMIKGGMPSVGRNRGLEVATQEIIFFIDADVRLMEEDVLVKIYEEFVNENMDCGAPLFKSKNDSKINKRNIRLANFAKKVGTRTPLFIGEWSTFIVCTKSILEKVGGFDEDLEYMEDSLLVRRILQVKGVYDLIHTKVGVDMINASKKDLGKKGFGIKGSLGVTLGMFSLYFIQFEATQKFAYKLNQKAKKLYGPLGGIVKFENPYKPKDREGGYPISITKGQRRFFEIIQGVVFWVLLLAPVILGLLGWDIIFVIYLAFLVSYWAFRAVKLAIGVGIGYKRFNEETHTDWMKKIKEKGLKDRFDDMRFIYLCPVYSENMSVLDPSFKSFAKNTLGAEKIDVVMAIEEKKQDLQLDNFKKLEKKYGSKFGSMQYYVHPAGIPGEVAGVKGANINWAARHYVEKLESEGRDIHDYMLITCDSDQRIHPKYLAAVAYKYLTAEEPDMQYYGSAIHSFENNIWRVPSLIRSQSNMMTMAILYTWVMDKTAHVPFTDEKVYVKDTFSSYVVNLKTLHDFEYWDPEIANDDTAFYWNAMVRSKGTFKSQEVYLPTYNDAVENETVMKTYVSYYKQQHRWGWGGINVPIALSVMFSDNEDFPWYRKWKMIGALMEYQVWFLTVAGMLSFGVQAMKLLSPTFGTSVYGANLSNLLGVIFTGFTILNIPLIYFRRKIMPVPKDWPFWRHIWDFAETYLTTINMLTFGLIPFIQAKTEILLGKSDKMRNFYVTEKVKIKKSKS